MKVAIIILIVLYFLTRKSKSKTGVSKRPLTEKPSVVVPNDKIILISNATLEEVKKALKDFCNQYNQEDYAALPRVYSLSETEYVLTFPYNVDLNTFCFAINYLAYPVNIKWKAEIHGWSTVSKNEGIDQENLEGKVCMFYLVDDKEYDNVYLTSSDNFCYKIPFTNFKPKAITPPIELFRNLPQKLADLSHLPYEDIE